MHKSVAGVLIVASLGVGAAAFAPAAGAEPAPNGAAQGQICDRAHDAWTRLVAANERAVAAYRKLRAKQQELTDAGHEVAARRLDRRLDAARRRHERVKARVLEIASRVRDRCSETPPVLTEP
jgi:hypothetical protein